jgi:hypothetical protein
VAGQILIHLTKLRRPQQHQNRSQLQAHQKKGT